MNMGGDVKHGQDKARLLQETELWWWGWGQVGRSWGHYRFRPSNLSLSVAVRREVGISWRTAESETPPFLGLRGR